MSEGEDEEREDPALAALARQPWHGRRMPPRASQRTNPRTAALSSPSPFFASVKNIPVLGSV